MRDIGRRLRALEEAKRMDERRTRPRRTLPDFYAAIWDQDHPDHDDTYRSLAHFYGGRVSDLWKPKEPQ